MTRIFPNTSHKTKGKIPDHVEHGEYVSSASLSVLGIDEGVLKVRRPQSINETPENPDTGSPLAFNVEQKAYSVLQVIGIETMAKTVLPIHMVVEHGIRRMGVPKEPL
ncbi:hypothetical protein NLI96_g12438 [Meripilus lineatus]|uniref:Uncharacterized protein n=1 Tax=Meripilus lineatus TaxID=2056292 RepID=A0AAD5UPV6_9APHY|nr:hypothetical protein NLI96_g12438 [Physisporinus lineatus]